MASINCMPLIPATCSGRATPGPGPASRRARTSCSWASQDSIRETLDMVWIFRGLKEYKLTVAYAIDVATIIKMNTPVKPDLQKPQGCTNLKLRQLMRR